MKRTYHNRRRMADFEGTKCALFLFSYLLVIDAYCNVGDIPVQPDFDIKRYTGVTLYVQKLTPIPYFPAEGLYTDYTHVYYLHQDGTTISYFASWRNATSPYNCDNYRRDLETTDIPGRWMIVPWDDDTEQSYQDYIIVSTDYEAYSVVYKCAEKLPNDDCVKSEAWIYSTTPQLSTEKMSSAEGVVSTLCINVSTMIDVQQTEKCPVDTDCAIYTIEDKVMQNFDAQKLAGKWFVTRYLPGRTITEIGWNKAYQLNYAPDNKGTEIQVFPRGRMDDAEETCFYSEGQLLPADKNGKFVYRRIINKTFHLTDVWMMSADDEYDNYVLWYGCQETDDAGICTYQTSWVLSRKPGASEAQQALIDVKLHELCLNSSNFVTIDNSNPCPDPPPSTGATITNEISMFLMILMVTVFYEFKTKY